MSCIKMLYESIFLYHLFHVQFVFEICFKFKALANYSFNLKFLYSDKTEGDLIYLGLLPMKEERKIR